SCPIFLLHVLENGARGIRHNSSASQDYCFRCDVKRRREPFRLSCDDGRRFHRPLRCERSEARSAHRKTPTEGVLKGFRLFPANARTQSPVKWERRKKTR